MGNHANKAKPRSDPRLYVAAAAIIILLACDSISARSQWLFEPAVAPCPVFTQDGTQLLSPFTGGLLAARIGIADIDIDELPDLLALNVDGSLRHYRNLGNLFFRLVENSPYRSAPVRRWFRLADLDGDSIPDLLTSGERSELLLYRNRGSIAMPVWDAAADTLRENSIIYTQQETVPSLVDIDDDGDLDLFSGNIEGSITFYRNDGNATSPQFVLVSSRYQNILIISSRTRLKTPPVLLSGSLHGASVLDFADIDGDDDLDMLFGDFFTTKLLLLWNDGTPSEAIFSMQRLDTAFRGLGQDVVTLGFNQPVIADLDNDGDLDALISSLYPNSPFPQISLFKNIGSATAPNMVLHSRNPTLELDLGAYAVPTVISDATMNGLIVGTSDGSITYIEINQDLSSTEMSIRARYTGDPLHFNATPAAGDIDGDGRAEIVMGSADGGDLLLYAIDGNALVRQTWQLDTLVAGRYLCPTLADIDTDGDLDLVYGASNGRLALYRNIGSPTSPIFRRENLPPPLDTLDLGSESAPRFFDFDRDGDLDIVIGARIRQDREEGIIRFYLNRGDRFERDTLLPDIPSDINVIPQPIPLAEGLFLMIGTRSGGIMALRNMQYTSGIGLDTPQEKTRSLRWPTKPDLY